MEFRLFMRLPVLAGLTMLALGCNRGGPAGGGDEAGLGGGIEEVIAPADELWDDLPVVEPEANDWPWWLGPTHDSKAHPDQRPPTTWSETENVVWRADVPGRGHGSPVLWGSNIFLPTADEDNEIQYLLCYDRATGKKRWQTVIHEGGFMHMHPKNSHASSTAACDGTYVYIPFMVQDAIWLTAVDFEGKIAWQEKLSPFKSKHGFAVSPFIYRSLLIVPCDNPGPSCLVGVHRHSGEVVYRVPRTDYQNFSSPLVAHVCGREQLLIPGPYRVKSYDPATGAELWSCEGPTDVAASTMAAGDELVYATAGYPEKNLLCIRADGSGDVTDSHLVWQMEGNAAYVPTPLLHEGLLYLVNDGGLLFCFDAQTGEIIWREQLDGNFSASPMLAGGNIYVPNEAGMVYVFKPGRKFELVAQNNLDGGGFASPVFCDNRIYLRTSHRLWCLGEE